MANSFSKTTETVMGDRRVLIGTLTCDSTDEAATGLNYVDFATAVGVTMTYNTTNPGGITPDATSGSYSCLVIGK